MQEQRSALEKQRKEERRISLVQMRIIGYYLTLNGLPTDYDTGIEEGEEE